MPGRDDVARVLGVDGDERLDNERKRRSRDQEERDDFLCPGAAARVVGQDCPVSVVEIDPRRCERDDVEDGERAPAERGSAFPAESRHVDVVSAAALDSSAAPGGRPRQGVLRPLSRLSCLK